MNLTAHCPACKTEAAIDAYLQEVKAMTTVSFQETPMQKTNPYLVIGHMEVLLTGMKQAILAREASKYKRLEHEANVLLTRANIESVDLVTQDLL